MVAVPAVSEPTSGDRPPERPTKVTPLAVGVVVWLASELMFFAGLFATYYTLRAENSSWPPADVDLDVPRALIFTLVLILSSVTMHLCTHAADQGRRRSSLRWLFAT